jgi:hypothetical protein
VFHQHVHSTDHSFRSQFQFLLLQLSFVILFTMKSLKLKISCAQKAQNKQVKQALMKSMMENIQRLLSIMKGSREMPVSSITSSTASVTTELTTNTFKETPSTTAMRLKTRPCTKFRKNHLTKVYDRRFSAIVLPQLNKRCCSSKKYLKLQRTSILHQLQSFEQKQKSSIGANLHIRKKLKTMQRQQKQERKLLERLRFHPLQHLRNFLIS